MDDYTKINIYKLQEFKESPCDVYAQLATGKILVICKKEMQISEKLVEKVASAEGCEILVKTSDYPLLHKDSAEKAFKMFRDDLQNNSFVDRAKRIGLEIDALKVVQLILTNVGISDYIIGMANETLDATLHTLDKNPTISSLIRYIFESEDIFSKKSLLINYIALATLSKTDWNNETNRKKLSLACFLCDYSITDSNLLMLTSEEEIEDIDKSDKKTYLQHSTKEANKLSKNNAIPDDVIKIVEQHHETPELSGFPNHPQVSSIIPLSAVYILSQEFVFDLLKKDFNKSTIKTKLYEMKERNFSGHFEQVYKSLCANF